MHLDTCRHLPYVMVSCGKQGSSASETEMLAKFRLQNRNGMDQRSSGSLQRGIQACKIWTLKSWQEQVGDVRCLKCHVVPFQAMQSLLDVKDFTCMLDGISNLLLLRGILLSAGLACSSSRPGQNAAPGHSSTPSSGPAFSHNSCSGADVPGAKLPSLRTDGAWTGSHCKGQER